MAFKNIAKYGYHQTVAGSWDVGNGTRMSFGIQDARAERFTLEIFGPTTQNMRDQATNRQRLAAATNLSLEGSSTADAQPVNVGAGGGLAVLLANLVNVAASFNVEHKSYTRVLRTAFALGAPIYHGDNIQNERKRETIQEALRARGTRGLGDLTWVARHYRGVLDAGPYFIEDGGRDWWQSGIIVVPQGRQAAMGSSATIATDIILRVRTDLAGKELYLELTATDNHRPVGTWSGVFGRPRQQNIYNPADVATIEAWQ